MRTLLEQDQLEEFQFEMRYSNPEYPNLLAAMKGAQRLKRLAITVNLKKELVEHLNKFIGKDAYLKSLAISFVA